MKIVIPDMISNSYFPVAAAVELEFFQREGLDMELALIFPVSKAFEALRDGSVQFVGGSAHAVPSAFPNWNGAKLIAAQAQNTYWFLVVRADLKAKQGDLAAIKGLKIGAAPMVNMGLKQLIVDAGLDEARDNIQIVPVPHDFLNETKNFGVAAAKALEAGLIDGFWANGMGAEVAVRSGSGTLVIDARRGDGPKSALHYTLSALVTSDAMIASQPKIVAAAVRALVKTQAALKADVSLATKVGEKLFPASEAALIRDIIARDLPYYDAAISPDAIAGLLAFQKTMGLIDSPIAYEQVVATQFCPAWQTIP